jgi:asparagine synthase (glutamine-hydrolysing)
MCGIAGIIAFNDEGKKYLDKIDDAVKSLHHRGPDGNGVFRHGNVALGHTRLAIIDTSDAAAQPFTSGDGRYTIVFNGEIFNYKELRAELEKEGCVFRSQSDTEVLLTLYAKEGKECLNKLNGFFAFAIYDKQSGQLAITRDRYGEKPLYVVWNSNFFAFSSEVKTLIPFCTEPKLFTHGFEWYLHLNYTPYATSLFEGIKPLDCGHVFTIQNYYPSKPEVWYSRTLNFKQKSNDSYGVATKTVRKLLEAAVDRRLISDVPIGSFLSGGIDSSVVSAIAARQKSVLETFSIGYEDEPYFDETEHAQIVARHIKSKHHVFSVTNADLLESLHAFLNQLDTPFADSSALAVNMLARETRKHVTVAISGDGADELFAGYNKHAAEYLVRNPRLQETFIRAGKSIWNSLPASRQTKVGNTVRQLRKFAHGMNLSPSERYWEWAGFTRKSDIEKLLRVKSRTNDTRHFSGCIEEQNSTDLNDVLRNDFDLVLEGDMLVKVDRMSMLNSLEVRSPFLDHELVEYVMSLPSEYKINRHERKRILKDACRDLLPPEIFTRKKQGFEVPLLKWFRGDLRGMIDELLDEKFLKEQNLFNPEEVKNIRKQLHSSDPGDSAARIWGLIVFQSWYKKFLV